MSREKKVVVITGASAGVGRATVRAFAQQGADIGLIARGKAGLEAARREVEEAGGRAVVVVADVSDPQAMDDAAERIEQALGPIDIWVNNAMVTVFSFIDDLQPDELARVTDVTYHGSVYGTLAALKRMKRRDRGVIIQVGSALAHRGIPLQAAYCAAKHALKGFSDSLRAELQAVGSQIEVCMVQLPALNTPQFEWLHSHIVERPQPVPPIFQPEVAADAIVWAAANPRPELMVGRSTVVAVWGNRIAPSVVDWKLGRDGVDSQTTGEPTDPHQRSNLWEPVDEDRDFGAHGRFDEVAAERSLQQPLTRHRVGIGVAAAALAVAGAWWSASRKREEPEEQISIIDTRPHVH